MFAFKYEEKKWTHHRERTKRQTQKLLQSMWSCDYSNMVQPICGTKGPSSKFIIKKSEPRCIHELHDTRVEKNYPIVVKYKYKTLKKHKHNCGYLFDKFVCIHQHWMRWCIDNAKNKVFSNTIFTCKSNFCWITTGTCRKTRFGWVMGEFVVFVGVLIGGWLGASTFLCLSFILLVCDDTTWDSTRNS